MPFQINRRPVALDDAVGAKAWPQVQTQLADQVVAVYDCTDQYLWNLKFGGNLYGGGNTSGTAQRQTTAAAQLVVPAGEAWFIMTLTPYTAVGLAAGHVISHITCAIAEPGIGNVGVTGQAQWIDTKDVQPGYAAGEIVWPTFRPEHWFGPSATATANYQGSGLAAFQVYWAWTGYRVRI